MIDGGGNAYAGLFEPPVGVVPPPADSRLDGVSGALRAAGGDAVRAILLYGSHVQASEPDRFSAFDLIVLVDGYRRFYDGMAAAGLLRRSPAVMAAWSHVLLPTSVSFDPRRPDGAVAKCQLVSTAHFRETLGPRSKDHFLKGRTVQRLALVWARDEAAARFVFDTLRRVQEQSVKWVRPYLPAHFVTEQYAETMLRVSYAAEIRPETGDRVREVYEAQRDTLGAIARQAMEAAVARGEAAERDGGWVWTLPPGGRDRLAATAYFARSKTRATARWIKHIATFEDWPLYIMRKLERRAGLRVDVTERERRWPFILLWPKLFHVLRELKRGRRPGDTPGGISTV